MGRPHWATPSAGGCSALTSSGWCFTGAGPNAGLAFHDFNTRYCRLDESNVLAALHASGAIPFVLTGERDISGAPPGQYWDGGIIDYHFDLTSSAVRA